METVWFLSRYDEVKKASRSVKELESNNNSKLIAISSQTIDKGFKMFYKSKEFNDFATVSKDVYWYYYNECGTVFAYGMLAYLENEL